MQLLTAQRDLWPKAQRDLWLRVLFLACLIFFINRGPYRAIRYSTTGDFSTVYAATRCWLHGANPYDRSALKAELAAAGAPADIQHDQDINPSVYLPSAMPWTAALATLRWRAANICWCLLSLLLFAASLCAILSRSALSSRGKWFAGSAALAFSPAYVGIYDGNPGVIVISLVALALCPGTEPFATVGGVFLGIALCFKPQLALSGILVFAIWKKWKPLAAAIAVLIVSLVIGVVVVSRFGHDWAWWHTEQHNLAVSFQPGGQSDPAPSSAVAWQMLNLQALFSYVIHDRRACDTAVWVVIAGLTALFWHTRRRSALATYWQDVAFFSTATLMITYHRYYDGQLLLLLIPLLALIRAEHKASFAVICGCLLVLAFPLQSIFARRLGTQATTESLKQVLLLRNQPAAVLLIACTLALCCAVRSLPEKEI